VCCQIVILPRKGLDSYHDDDDSATLRRLSTTWRPLELLLLL